MSVVYECVKLRDMYDKPEDTLVIYDFNKEVNDLQSFANLLIKGTREIVSLEFILLATLRDEVEEGPIGLADSFWIDVALGNYSE